MHEKTVNSSIKLIGYKIFHFRHYIVICAMAANSEQLLKWSGLVESKIRILIGQLEANEAFQSVHIYPRSYDAPPTMDDQEGEGSSVGSIWFIGLDLKKSGEISITAEAQFFINAGQHDISSLSLSLSEMHLQYVHVCCYFL